MSTALTVNTEQISAIATGFLQRTEQVRYAVANTLKEYPFAASAAILAAQFSIEDSMTPEDKAFIKKCAQKGRIERAGQVADDDMFSCVAEAAAKGLLFGCDQYGVWPRGKLYIKEGGYRQLFAMRGDCSHLDIKPGLPEWRVLKDKTMWVIPGTASVKVAGQLVTVVCEGDYSIGINGNPTDIIASIEAKAARSLAKRLWKKVASIDMDDTSDDVASVEAVDPERIEQTTKAPAAATTTTAEPHKQPPAKVAHKAAGEALLKSLSSDPSQAAFAQDVWQAMTEAVAPQHLIQICGDTREGVMKLSKDNQRRFANYKRDLLAELEAAEQG